MFTLFSLLSGIFTAWRTLWHLKINIYWKSFCTLAVLLIATRFKIFRFFYDGSGELKPIMLLFSALFAWFFIFFLLTVAESIICGIFSLVQHIRKKYDKKRVLRAHNYAMIALLILSLATVLAGMISGTADAEVKREEIYISNLPDSADGMKLVLLADIHVDEFTVPEKIQRLVKKVNSLSPDAVLIVGDLADGKVSEYGKIMAELKNISPVYGVYGVTGNHDHFYDFDNWMKFFEEHGIKMLCNQFEKLPNGVIIAGIPDPVAERFGREKPDFQKLWKNIPGNSPVILLSHRPALAEQSAEHRAALQLSGHTHGGMMPLFSSLVALFNKGWVSGRYRVGDMQLYVSNGTGIWNGFPVRIACPAEITLITLKKNGGR